MLYTFISMQDVPNAVQCTNHVHTAISSIILAPSSAPTEVSSSGVTSVGLTLSWNNPPEVYWNGQIRHFLVNITEENTGLQYELTTITNIIEVNSLHPSYTYLCSVTAVTVSAGPYSSPISVTTMSAGENMTFTSN